MDDFGLADRFYEMDESDLQVFGDDSYDSQRPSEDTSSGTIDVGLSPVIWFDSFLNSPVLNDCMMSEAACSPFIKSEHSYSVYGDDQACSSGILCDQTNDMDQLDEDDKEKDTRPAKPSQPQSLSASSNDICSTVKCEPVPAASVIETRRSLLRQQQQRLPPGTNLSCSASISASCLKSEPGSAQSLTKAERMPLPRISIKVETGTLEVTTHGGSCAGSPAAAASAADDYGDSLPPTPPGSSSNSDSDGGCGGGGFSRSPSPLSHRGGHSSGLNRASRFSSAAAAAAAVFSQPIPTSGVLALTEEEKRTLASEGYPIPVRLPLTKQEERNLKKVRRKIKNKISAQESRRKKKEYVDQLEKRVEILSRENGDLRKKCDAFHSSNASLMSQLRRLQTLVTKCVTASQAPAPAQIGTTHP